MNKDKRQAHPETVQTLDTTATKRDRKKDKKMAYILIAALCVVGIGSAVVLQNPQWFERKPEEKNTSMYSDRIVSYSFYPTDYDLDVTADETYMGLNRYLYYTNGPETIAITNGDYAQYGAAIAFFGQYFETVIAGDTDTYNTYFTEHYYETNAPHERFAPQMLYNLNVTKLWEELEDDTVTRYAFDVTYMIHRNDGTFRNDIDSDSSKTLYFELVEENDVVKIDRITYYVRRTQGS